MNAKLLIGHVCFRRRSGRENSRPSRRPRHPEVNEAQSNKWPGNARRAERLAGWRHGAERPFVGPAQNRRRHRSQGPELAQIESRNTGKPYALALADEIRPSPTCSAFFAGAARCLTGAVAGEYMPGMTSMIRRDPVGRRGLHRAWNYPLMMAAWKMAPALAAGTRWCSSHRSRRLSPRWRGRNLVGKSCLRRGQCRVRPRPIGRTALVRQPEVSMVSLTGSIPSGKVLEAPSPVRAHAI